MSIIEHILLFSFIFIFYAFWGKYNAHRNSKAFWEAAIIPIALYVFIVGSRYGWGNDYLIYKFEFEHAFTFKEEQVAFKWLNQFMNLIGFSYAGAYMGYAFIFIVCAFVFLRSYREAGSYMYSFLIPATLYVSAHTIRQGVGISFLFLALVFFHKRKWFYMILATLIAFNIHYSTIVTLMVILGIFFIFRNPIHYLLSIPAYLFFSVAFDVGKMSFLAEFLSEHISLNNKFQNYIDNSNEWFGADAVNEIYAQSTLALLMSSLFYIAIFYLGYKALKVRRDKHVLYLFNTVVIGSILLRATFLYEILRRFTEPFVMFYFVPLGYIFYVYFKDCKQPESYHAVQLKKIFPIGITFIMMYLLMFWGRFILLNADADFFWYH